MKTISSTFGRNINITIYGGSHEPEIGVIIKGLPEDFTVDEIDMDKLNAFLQRRAPGNSPYATPRKEADAPVLKSTEPLAFAILNFNQHSKDYEKLLNNPRPGHADFTAKMKYQGEVNMAGGGPFSARMTAPMCIAGGIALQILEDIGVTVSAELIRVGGVTGDAMYDKILEAKEAQDSVGGLVRCTVKGMPVGVGGPMYDGLESYIAPIVFGIPAVKGISFGKGFEVCDMLGSENNDPFIIEDGEVKTKTNNAGGILGGISNGMDIVMDVAFKPTPSIAMEQDTVDLEKMEPAKLSIVGRHDPCVAVRGVPVVEAAMALGILDAMMEDD